MIHITETPKDSTIDEINKFQIGTVFYYDGKRCIVARMSCSLCIFRLYGCLLMNCSGRTYVEHPRKVRV